MAVQIPQWQNWGISPQARSARCRLWGPVYGVKVVSWRKLLI